MHEEIKTKNCMTCYYNQKATYPKDKSVESHCTAGHSRTFDDTGAKVNCKDYHEPAICKASEIKCNHGCCFNRFPARNENHVFCSHACRSHWHQEQQRKGRMRGFASLLGLMLQENLRQKGMSQDQINKEFKEVGLHW